MRRLIWTFAVSICPKTCFPMAIPYDYMIHSETKMYMRTCAFSENSDQRANPCSLIRIFIGHPVDSQRSKASQEDNVVSDQTGRMRRLIWVFAGGTCLEVQFLTSRPFLSVFISCPQFLFSYFRYNVSLLCSWIPFGDRILRGTSSSIQTKRKTPKRRERWHCRLVWLNHTLRKGSLWHKRATKVQSSKHPYS